MHLQFSGAGENEKATDIASGKVLLRVNPKFFRPVDSSCLRGDPSKARRILDWNPNLSGEQVAVYLTRAEIEKQESTL